MTGFTQRVDRWVDGWIERHQRDLGERRRRAPLRSWQHRRRATIGLFAGAAVASVAGAAEHYVLRGVLSAVWVVAIATAMGCSLLLATDRRTRFLERPTEELDERELRVREAARADAYRFVTIVVLLLAVVGLFSQLDGLSDRASLALSRSALHALTVFAVFVMPALPATLESLRHRDDAEVDALAGDVD